MKKEALKRIFEFLEEKGEHRAPFLWKFKNNEPLIEEDLNVKGNLNLFQSNITSLPEGLKVEGDLDLSISKIMLLPKGLKVGGDLSLANTKITSLPEGLEVGGDLNIVYTDIKSLPKGLEVGGDLDLIGTPLADDYDYNDDYEDELREMVYPGFIIMEKQALKRIFDFLEEKEEHRAPFLWKFKNNEPLIEEDLNIKGDLNLHNSKITSLPRGLKVGGYLNLYLIDITSLPNDLTVDGALFLMGSKITSLPEGLKVGGNLHINNTPLKKYTNKQLIEMIKPGVIKGKIYRR